MKTNHYLGKFVLPIIELPPIVASGNNLKEQKRILNELYAVKNSSEIKLVTVDANAFSFKKVIPIVEASRMGMQKYTMTFIEILHPELDGAFDFQESFIDITEKGSTTALATLMNQSDEYIIHYSRWIQHTVKEKLSAIRETNEEYMGLLELKQETVQEATTWKEPHQLRSSQMDLSILLDDCFNPVSHTIDPHLSINPSPSFQRNLVWTTDMKQSFIDSILRKLPIGAFYVNNNIHDLTLGEGAGKLLWDGKQRVHAVLSFYKDEFPVQYEGKDLYYSQMRQVFNAAVRQTLVTIMTSEYETLEEIVEAYVMVNAKQVKHTDEDLEKAKETLKKKQEKNYTI